MKNVKVNESLDNTNAFFDYSFETLDLNKDMEKLYEIIDDEEMQDEFEQKIRLSKLRNKNYERYYNIDILKYKNLPQEFEDVIEDITNLYNYIDSKKILNGNVSESKYTNQLLDNIYRRINRLDMMVKSSLKQLTKSNDDKQARFSITYFNNLDISNVLKKDLIEKYNNLVLYGSFVTEDIYEDIKRQSKREEYIGEILKILNIEEEKKISLQKKDKLEILNKKIDSEILKYKEQIQYLEDLMPENSKHIEEFENFKDFCNKLIAYDDTSYDNTKQTYEILSDELRFKAHITNFEELFVQEIIDKQKEQEFIYTKVGIKNLRKSLDYITANYMDKLDEECKNIIGYIFDKLNGGNYDLSELNKALGLVVRGIWNTTITDVYKFNPNEDYSFICANNQFIDAKYQTILITKKEINRVEDYEDYQIGFICGYNDNIMYITENEDIMSVTDNDDMSNLKTPLQLEQEFMNFKVCNRIALNGFKTKIEAVYYINDGDMDKYMKAIELANSYKLPLIELKKD